METPFRVPYKNSILPIGDPFDDAGNSNPVTIIDQGYGFDPTNSLAVALYPHNPIAYYSFDANESLFGSGPLKPTSGFNNSILKGFKHYWQLNEENAICFREQRFQRQFDRQCHYLMTRFVLTGG